MLVISPGSDDSGRFFVECSASDICLGDGCADGYTGAFCSECDVEDNPNLVKIGAFECGECLSQGLMIGVIVAGLLLAGVGLAYKIADAQDEEDEAGLHSIFAKVFVSALQINSLALSFAFDWQDAMEQLLGAQAEVTTLGTAYLELGCVFGLGDISIFEAETIGYICAPVIFVLFVFLGELLYNVIHRLVSRQPDNAEPDAEARAVTMWDWWGQRLPVVVVILFLLHPTLTERLALLFSCIKMGETATGEPELFLFEDVTIRCWEGVTQGTHARLLAMYVPLLMAFVVGVPVFALRLLLEPANRLSVHYLVAANILKARVTHTTTQQFRRLSRAHSKSPRQHLEAAPSDGKAQAANSENTTIGDEMGVSDLVTKQPWLEAPAHAFHKMYGFLFVGYEPDYCWWEVNTCPQSENMYSTHPSM